MVSVAVFVLVAVGVIGVLSELPKILSHHINQPVDRRRRERALRKKLALRISVVLFFAIAAYLTLNW